VLEYEEYLDLLAEFVERLDPRIIIERMFGEAPFNLLWRRTGAVPRTTWFGTLRRNSPSAMFGRARAARSRTPEACGWSLGISKFPHAGGVQRR
jgi:hypothetical protein